MSDKRFFLFYLRLITLYMIKSAFGVNCDIRYIWYLMLIWRLVYFQKDFLYSPTHANNTHETKSLLMVKMLLITKSVKSKINSQFPWVLKPRKKILLEFSLLFGNITSYTFTKCTLNLFPLAEICLKINFVVIYWKQK